MQAVLQLVFQSIDIILGLGWLLLLAVNVREVRSYRNFTLPSSDAPTEDPVSVIVPARNEEGRIAVTIDSILGQSAGNLEVIVVDDRSTDGTSDVVAEMRAKDSRLVLVRGQELPPGWAGKNWACKQGFDKSRNDWLLFMDSDTRLAPSAIAASINYAKEERLDALSLIPRTEYSGFWARIAGPALTWLIRLAYPLRRVGDPSDRMGIAVGSFLLLKREAYLRCGGHEAVRAELVEDKEVATNLKAQGVPYRLLVGRQFVVTGLFTGEQSLWESLRRVASNPLKNGKWQKMVVVAFGLLLLLMPTALLLLDLAVGAFSSTEILVAVISLSAPIALVSYDASGTSPPRYSYALLAQLGGIIVLLAIARQILGQSEVSWRGRIYSSKGRSS